MDDTELRVWAEAHAPAGSTLARGVLRLLGETAALRGQIAGLEKAAALMNAGMGSLTERYDELKHENRKLQEQITGHVERVAAQSELLSRRAENPAAAENAQLRGQVAEYLAKYPQAEQLRVDLEIAQASVKSYAAENARLRAELAKQHPAPWETNDA